MDGEAKGSERMSEQETNMEVVKCICDNRLLMKSECDFDDVETDTWTFNLSVECHDELNDCCKRRIKYGIDNTINGVLHLQSIASEMNRNYVINIELPEEMEEE